MAQQEGFQKLDLGLHLVLGVGTVAEVVAVAVEPDVPDDGAVALDCGDDLIGLFNLDSRVVLRVHDQQRFSDSVGVGQRRNRMEELAGGRVALVAVFGAPVVDCGRAFVLQAGLEIRETRDVDARRSRSPNSAIAASAR